MTGIVNTTGARSGVIGTTVGTPVSGGLVKIGDTQEAAGTGTIDLTGFSTAYSAYQITVTNATCSVDTSRQFCVNAYDSGGSAMSKLCYHSYMQTPDSGSTPIKAEPHAAMSLTNTTANFPLAFDTRVSASTLHSTNSDDGTSSGTFYLYGAGDTAKWVKFMWFGASDLISALGSGWRYGRIVAGGVTTIKFMFDSGNVASGTFTLYGLAK